MPLTHDDLRHLLALLDVTAPREIDCTELLHRVAAYVERHAPSGAPPPGADDVKRHLAICPECLEEYETLLDAVAPDR
ncbi:MAG: hypothetical protein ACF8XB_22040 [Planctomycetota bacterium JB042]